MAPADFKKLNIRGAITYSQFTMAQAKANNERSSYPDPEDRIAPSVQLLLDETQYERVRTHIIDVYLPEAVARAKAKEKKDAIEQKYADRIKANLENRELEGPPYLLVKEVYAKSVEAVPWAVATLKFKGTAGRDIEKLARVNDESELRVPDPNALTFPTVRPIDETVHELYPGAWAYATLNLSGYFTSAGSYGISAYSNSVVFLENRDRLGGGGGVLDTEDIFLDD